MSDEERSELKRAEDGPIGFLDFKGLCERVPLSPRTIREAIKKGHIPAIRLPKARRYLFSWPAVKSALSRYERATGI